MNNLISLYQQHLNLPNATFTRIDHDDAIVAVVYKITQPNSTPLILKICPRPKSYLREAWFLNHFAGTLPVPKLIKIIEPQDHLQGAILMECLPGTLLSEVTLTENLAYETGSLLARIHLNRTAGYGDIINPEALSLDPRIHFAKKFEEHFAESRDHLPQKLLKQCYDYFTIHIDLLTSVDGPCIIHRDYRPGNIMVHNGKIQGIIDWASGRAGFAEEDLNPYGWPEDETRKSFLAGYASVRPVPDYNAIMPLLRMNRIISVLGFLIREGTWATTQSNMYQTNRQFLEAFFG